MFSTFMDTILKPLASLRTRLARRIARCAPPPHRRWVPRVLNSKSKSLPNIYQAHDAQLQKPRPRSQITPSLFSPPDHAHSAGPPKNLSLFCLGRVFFDFWTFQKELQNLLRKIIQKNAKIKGFGLPKPSQNPSKILPKSWFQKTYQIS